MRQGGCFECMDWGDWSGLVGFEAVGVGGLYSTGSSGVSLNKVDPFFWLGLLRAKVGTGLLGRLGGWGVKEEGRAGCGCGAGGSLGSGSCVVCVRSAGG